MDGDFLRSIHVFCLVALVITGLYMLGQALFADTPRWMNPTEYAHPASAIGVGPTEGEPPMHYMYAWHDPKTKRLCLEFRNVRGFVICADERVMLP